MISELVKKTRSYRRFDAKRAITDGELRAMIESARCSGSTANRQRIRFAYVNQLDICNQLFANIKLAGYLTDWCGPTEQERPTAYIVMMCKEDVPDLNLGIDMGIAAQSILLTATEMGLGGCMIRSFNKPEFDRILNKDGYGSAFVIALGEPTENVYLTDVKNGDIKYFRDQNDDHAVPKYSLNEIII